MLGIAIILLVSWLLLHLLDKSSLFVLGIELNFSRLKLFLLCFFITALLCGLVNFFEILLSGSELQLNKLGFQAVLNGLWWDFKSVVTEELVFRGALFYLLYKKVSSSAAIYATMISFGVYHWFSFGLWGQILPMIVVFIGTALMGYAFAMSFVKSKTIFAPFGLHLGWNFTLNTIFSSGPHGMGLIQAQNGKDLSDWFSLIELILIPLLLCYLVHKLPYKRFLAVSSN